MTSNQTTIIIDLSVMDDAAIEALDAFTRKLWKALDRCVSSIRPVAGTLGIPPWGATLTQIASEYGTEAENILRPFCELVLAESNRRIKGRWDSQDSKSENRLSVVNGRRKNSAAREAPAVANGY